MSKRLLSLLFFFMIYLCVHAGDKEYAVSKIPAELLKNANVVKRYAETKYEVVSFTKMRTYEKTVITILNENGDEFAALVEFYDKVRSVKSIEGKLYDAEGKELKSVKPKDIEDRSAVSDISLIEDSRVKLHRFYHRVYPYTVEYEVMIEFNNTYIFPQWMPQPAEKYAVEKSTIEIVTPSWFGLHYKAFNYPGEPAMNTVKEDRSYTWQVNMIPARIREYAAPEWTNLTTCVFFSPDKFEFSGYKGGMDSWKNIGLFQLQLNKDRDKLPDAVRKKVHQLTDAITDPKKKVAALYKYLQENTRYISIQLGIGGLQPFDASYVAAKAYGDCKALSNYMYALLKEAGIRSCYTQIKAGAGKHFFMPDFPSDQFNHIILCVPMATDTMWLECTSQTLPAGYLGDFTCNRYALLIDETGGHLVHTPSYGLQDNQQVRKVNAVLGNDGTLSVKTSTRYTGLQQDDIHGMINNLSRDKVKEYLHSQLDFPTYDIQQFDYKEERSSLPHIDESLDISVSNYATMTGKRLFIMPNIMTRATRKLAADEDRRYDIVFIVDYRDVDSVEIALPEGYSAESIPSDISLSNKFGKYSCSVKLSGNKLLYYRTIERYAGRFPAKDYNELVKFYESIYKADRNKVVLVKQEGTKGF